MLRSLLAFALVLLATSAFAKDDRPNAKQLAIDYPWHPVVPTITDLELSCNKDVKRYELRIDDRGWQHLIGADYEAAFTPFGRFLKAKDGAWTKIDLDAWLLPRDGTIGLRELTGAPLIPDDWQLKKTERTKEGTVEVSATDKESKERTLVFDTIAGLWIRSDGLFVTDTKRFQKRMLPASISLGGGCALKRTIREAKPPMPDRSVFPD